MDVRVTPRELLILATRFDKLRIWLEQQREGIVEAEESGNKQSSKCSLVKVQTVIKGMTMDKYGFKLGELEGQTAAGVVAKIDADLKSHGLAVGIADIQKCLTEEVCDTYSTIKDQPMMLAVMLGMAIAKYNYEPGANRNTATGTCDESIHAALERSGGDSVDNDTIHRYLKLASELHPSAKLHKT